MIRWICNMCGNEIRDEPIALLVNKLIGYGSKYDMDKLHLKLCSDCMDKMIDSCKVSPVEEGHYIRTEVPNVRMV